MTMRTLSFLAALAVVALTACGDNVSSTTGTGTPPIMVAGLWTYSIDLSGSMHASCQASGITRLNQTTASNTFTGSAQGGTQICTSDAGTDGDQPLFLNFTNGEITGLAIRFLSQACVYVGAASPPMNDLVNDLAGTATCVIVLPQGGGNPTMTGTWHLSR